MLRDIWLGALDTNFYESSNKLEFGFEEYIVDCYMLSILKCVKGVCCNSMLWQLLRLM